MAATKRFKALEKEFVEDMFGISQCTETREIPADLSGDWEVRHNVDIKSNCTFQELFFKNKKIMDNNPKNLPLYKHFIKAAKGRVLITGLGLGASLHEILKKPEVSFVKVIEASEEVIDLVGSCFKNERVEIIHEDAFAYQFAKSERYDVVWHAIWTSPEENEERKEKLCQKYEKHCAAQLFLFDIPKRHKRKGNVGRPKGVKAPKMKLKSEDEKASIRKGVRFTQNEWIIITNAIEASGLPASIIMQRGTLAEANLILKQIAKTG